MDTNPHYVTPEEASAKFCHVMSGARHGIICQGPKCMAWRWQQTVVRKNNSVKMTPEGLVTTISTTHGYCGMVRHG